VSSISAALGKVIRRVCCRVAKVARKADETIAGYEAMNMIRKGQARWLAKGDIIGQIRFIEQLFEVAA